MQNADIQQLTEGAFKYGPFFFSILFVIFLTRWAYKKYDLAVTHTPPLDQRDKDINRWMFLTTFLFGIVLVVVSIAWWWWFKPNVYFFRGEIRNLQQQEDIASDVYYLRREVRDALKNEDAADLLRNEHFVIFQSHPFRKGQIFQLDYAKNHQRRRQLYINYNPDEEEPIYEVEYDTANEKPFLKRVTSEAPTTDGFLNWPFEQKVLASTELQMRSPATTTPSGDTDGDEKLIAILRDGRSDVAAKLDALDSLSGRDTTALKKDLQLNLPEPFALTIFDLTQHSDVELSSKATALAKRIDIDGYLLDQLSSDSPERRESAEKILLRISRVHAQAILRRVDVSKHEDLKRTSQEVNSGISTQVLKPTASLQGDRYYIKATWNPSDQLVVSCLEHLFNNRLESTRNLDQEITIMQGKNQRFIYWYSKDWAIDISKEIKKCGGNSEFVHPF